MVSACHTAVEAAIGALRTKFEVWPMDNECRIVAPFMRRDGDRFELFVRAEGDRFVLSDDGDTLDYLELSGVNTRRNRSFEKLVREIQDAHDVSFEQGAILTVADNEAELGEAIVRVTAALSDLSHFELTRREILPRTFDMLVEGELVGQGVPYEPRVTHQGQIRDRTFKFGVNSDRHMVIEPLRANSATRAQELAAVLIVSVEDVWRRDPRLGAVAVLDDSKGVWEDRALPDLEGSGLSVVRWSDRHSILPTALGQPRRGSDRRVSA